MKRLMIAALMSVFAVAIASAQECKPVDKTGKTLAGAARASHMKACCRKNAIDKNGKPMRGIVKTQFMGKCMQST
jgi:hypothetical protein